MISLQELFDGQCEFEPAKVGLLNSMMSLQKKYHGETGNATFSDEYYKEMKVIADHYELNYTEPKFRTGLKGVGSPLTIH